MIEFGVVLGAFLVGALGGAVLAVLVLKDRIEKQVKEEEQERSTNKKRMQLERNRRTLPRRDDAAPGASRVSQIQLGRNVKPRPRVKRDR